MSKKKPLIEDRIHPRPFALELPSSDLPQPIPGQAAQAPRSIHLQEPIKKVDLTWEREEMAQGQVKEGG